MVLSPEQVKLGLAKLEFRDQVLVFVDGSLGIRQGELVIAILVARDRWTDADTKRFGPKYHATICHWAVEIAEALKAKEKVDAGFK